jgi:hypothetical protein
LEQRLAKQCLGKGPWTMDGGGDAHDRGEVDRLHRPSTDVDLSSSLGQGTLIRQSLSSCLLASGMSVVARTSRVAMALQLVARWHALRT